MLHSSPDTIAALSGLYAVNPRTFTLKYRKLAYVLQANALDVRSSERRRLWATPMATVLEKFGMLSRIAGAALIESRQIQYFAEGNHV